MRRAALTWLVLGMTALTGCGDDDATESSTTSAPPTTVAERGGASVGGWYRSTPDANLELRVVVGFDNAGRADFEPDADQIVLPGPEGAFVYLLGPVGLDGSIVDRTRATFDDLNGWGVVIEMTPDGGEAFDELAATVLGEQLAVVSDGIVWSAPLVRQAEVGGTAIISGDFGPDEARELARLVAGTG